MQTEDMNKVSFVEKRVSESGNLFRISLLNANIYAFHIFPRIYGVFLLFTLIKVTKAQEENQVVLQVIPSVTMKGEHQILRRPVRAFQS